MARSVKTVSSGIQSSSQAKAKASNGDGRSEAKQIAVNIEPTRKTKKRKTLQLQELEELSGWAPVEYYDCYGDADEAANDPCAMMLEEIDGVQVIQDEDNKRLLFKVEDGGNTGDKTTQAADKSTKAKKSKKQKVACKTVPEVKDDAPAEVVDMTAWDGLLLHESLLAKLAAQKFTEPTEIQRKTIEVAVEPRCRDVMGAAQTGSGKSLAFGIPIVNYCLQHPEATGMIGLILCPTRELSLQVRNHIQAICDKSLRVIAIVGGMSMQKQTRLLKSCPQIVIATPGRLHEWLTSAKEHSDVIADYLANIKNTCKFLVLDEADRLVERGHFEPMESILDHVDGVAVPLVSTEFVMEGDQLDVLDGQEPLATATKRQTFVFSATLTLDNHKTKNAVANMDKSMSSIWKRVQFQDRKPVVIDLTTEQRMADKLSEYVLKCPSSLDKDVALYYFLLNFAMTPECRTIVFVNSIDSIKQLCVMLQELGIRSLTLHSQMEQRQRLKNLDKFKAAGELGSILIASDVAARGLDISNVNHVIHYHLPFTTELYVHRSGRTARAGRQGKSLMLCSPQEAKHYRIICKYIHGSADVRLEEFAMDLRTAGSYKPRVSRAVKIEALSRKFNRDTKDTAWLQQAAKDMDVDFDAAYHADLMETLGDSDDEGASAEAKRDIEKLKSELKAMGAPKLLEQT